MLNPWVSFGFQTARQAWEAQSTVMLRLVRMFGGGASTEEHSTKETGTSVTEIQTAPTPVEEHSIVSPTTKGGTDGSAVHKKVDGATEKRQPERTPKRAAKHTQRPPPVRRSRRKGR